MYISANSTAQKVSLCQTVVTQSLYLGICTS